MGGAFSVGTVHCWSDYRRRRERRLSFPGRWTVLPMVRAPTVLTDPDRTATVAAYVEELTKAESFSMRKSNLFSAECRIAISELAPRNFRFGFYSAPGNGFPGAVCFPPQVGPVWTDFWRLSRSVVGAERISMGNAPNPFLVLTTKGRVRESIQSRDYFLLG